MLGGRARRPPSCTTQAIAAADAAVGALHRAFLATPYRPTGLSTAARAIVRLVDELNWLNADRAVHGALPGAGTLGRSTCTVKLAAAAVLERGADLLDTPGASLEPLQLGAGGARAAR